MTTTFYTPNPIPIEALTTFGVSVKENDNPIGYFGTGFKYAVAVILRAGGKVTVHNGPDSYAFTSREKEIRGKPHNIIYINDQPLSFTTDLGKNWQMWMAFRELYSNTLDEGGTMNKGESPYRVVVECREFDSVDHTKIFLQTKPVWKNGALEIHPGRSNTIYYRGIRVGDLETESGFTYNIIGHTTLTEDRTIKWPWLVISTIQSVISKEITDEMLIRDIVHPKNLMEAKFNYESEVSASFERAVTTAVKNKRPVALNAIEAVQRTNKNTDSLKALKLSRYDSRQIEKACDALDKMGYDVGNYPIKVVAGLQGQAYGLAADETIYLSVELLTLGEVQIMQTILEEWMHLMYNYEDGSRPMMDWAFQQIIGQGLRRLSGE